jgi:hypothetical protein
MFKSAKLGGAAFSREYRHGPSETRHRRQLFDATALVEGRARALAEERVVSADRSSTPVISDGRLVSIKNGLAK